MRKYTLLVTILAALGWSAALGRAATDDALARMDGDTIARFHFAGTARIAADPQAASVNEIAALPETVALRNQTLDKLATTPFRLFEQKIANHNTNDYAPLIRPLLEDLLRVESYAELRGPTNEVPELMLAVQLDDAHAKVWQANLSTVLTAWTGIPVKDIQGEGYTGWELRKHHDPNLIRCLRAGDWLLFGWGWDELKLQPGFLQRIKERKRPAELAKDDWLDVLMDWPGFMAHHPFTLPAPLPAKLPKMHLNVQGRKTYIRPKLTLLYPEPLGLKMEPWKIPTRIIHNPMVSFTAARGTSSYLGDVPFIKALNPGTVPNQLFIWAMSGMPYETQFAAPVSGASNYLAKIAPGLLALTHAKLTQNSVNCETIWTNNQIVIGMPFISPHLMATREPSGDFLYGSLFPGPRRTNSTPLPQDLMREIGSKPNLVYYDWEINHERLSQCQALQQVYLMTSDDPPMDYTKATQKWFEAIKPKLGKSQSQGNCGTEVTLTGLNELTLLRNAPVAFTGFELVVLGYWLDAPGFPLHAEYPRPTMRHLPPKPPASH
jgi:hypothetical protein